MHLRKIRHRLEFLLTKLALVCIPLIPRAFLLKIAGFLGICAYYLSFHLRTVGLTNLDLAFANTMTAAQKRTILKTSFKTFALTLLDLFWFSKNSKERIGKYVHFNKHHDDFFHPTPLICLTAHMGNWELLGRATAIAGFPMSSVAAPLANKALDDLFNTIRMNTGQSVINKKGAVRKLLKILRNGGKVAFLLDQNTKPSNGGLFVNFFGLPVPISTIASSLVLHTGCPILFSCCIPQANGHYLVTDLRTIDPTSYAQTEQTQSIQLLTQDIANIMEQEIRAYPHAWLWMYKRWKYIAPGYTKTDYPFYAKKLT